MKYESVYGYTIGWIGISDLSNLVRDIVSGAIQGVGLNPYSGWDGTVLDLARIPSNIKALFSPYSDKIGVTSDFFLKFTELEMLIVAEVNEVIKIDHDKLETLAIHPAKHFVLGELPALRSFAIRQFDRSVKFSNYQFSDRLKRLTINDGNVSDMNQLSSCSRLCHLELANLKSLKSIEWAVGFDELQTLIIESCKSISDLQEVLPRLRSLRVLRLINCGVIDSVRFVSKLELVEFRLGRTIVRDGDLSPLDRVKIVAFDERAEYNRKRSEFSS